VAALNDLGVDMVIFPVSLLRLAMGAAERGLGVLRERGALSSLFDAMQSRSELYELLDYRSYELFDGDVFNFGSTT
jgi:methylisocitrate lyase